MRTTSGKSLMAIVLLFAALPASAAEPASRNAAPSLDRMPRELETEWALSALPAHLKAQATVYLLDPAKGYHVDRQGTNAFSCLVVRTDFFKAEYRNDLYVPMCFDADGVRSHLKVWMDAATMRAQGRSPVQMYEEITNRFRKGVYKAPERFGISYMLTPLMRVYTDSVNVANTKVMTQSFAHVMYFAPHVTEEDIGPNPGGSHPLVLQLPGHPHGYIVQGIGESETKQIVADQQPLLKALCEYRDVLCLPGMRAGHAH